jgi:scyllo-inositol 2-dehydrogenase (NADP+)
VVRMALIGLGKMGISHLAIVRSHPDVELVAVCDTTGYVLDVLRKYTGIKTYTNYKRLLAEETLDALVVATPSRFHGEMVLAALDQNLHVFCEKPFCLDTTIGQQLADLAEHKGLVNQVGYHFRFVGAFNEAKRLVDTGALGRIHHVRVEAYGPVVLRPRNMTWRARKSEGGGCLYDYACHAIDLVNYFVGCPERVDGTALNQIFSRDVEDEVYTTFRLPGGATGQLAANWSDESYRKMWAKLSLWGANGRLAVDRQEMQLYLRDASVGDTGLKTGWNVSYTTELSDNQWYYLRGEEYSAQIDHFVQCVKRGQTETISSFASAVQTDRVAAMMLDDAEKIKGFEVTGSYVLKAGAPLRSRSFFGRLKARSA